MIKKHFKEIRLLLKTNNLAKILACLVIAISIIGLSTAIICMYIGRPIGDDFGAVNYYRPDVWVHNTIQSLKETGRYGQSVFSSISYGLFGKQISMLLPLSTLLWLVAILYLYIKKADSYLTNNETGHKILSIITSLVITFLMLFVNNNIIEYSGSNSITWFSFQGFFWPAGIITYLIPILFLATALYFIFVRSNNLQIITKLIILSVFTFLSGLFNEVFPCSLIAISMFLLVASFIKPFRLTLKSRRPFLIAISISSLLAIAMLLLSAGSRSRQITQGVQSRLDLLNVVLYCAKDTIYLSYNMMFKIKDLIFVSSASVLLAIFIKDRLNISNRTINNGLFLGVAVIVSAILSLFCSLLLVKIGYGGGILTRTATLWQVLYTIGISVTAIFIFLIIFNIKKYGPVFTNIILSVSILSFCIFIPTYMEKIYNQLNSSVQYSNAWKKEEEIISTNKDTTIYLPDSVSGIGIYQTMSCEGSTWLNYQVAEYYGVKKICSELDPSGL